MVFSRDEREEIKALEHLCKSKLGSTIEKWLLNLCKCKVFEVVVQDPKMEKVS
jgi:hypothetical protein